MKLAERLAEFASGGFVHIRGGPRTHTLIQASRALAAMSADERADHERQLGKIRAALATAREANDA